MTFVMLAAPREADCDFQMGSPDLKYQPGELGN
jgi:hypothetical protein